MRETTSRRELMIGLGAAGGATLAGSGRAGGARRARTTDPAWEAVELRQSLAAGELATPALVVDRAAMERNLRRMVDAVSETGVQLRPHAKTHKCPLIARRQLELGAVGICAAKVSEAEVMVGAGVENVLITSPVVTTEKIERVIALARESSGVQMVVDNPKTARDFHDAASAAGIVLPVLVDLDVGTRRTGSPLGAPAVALAEEIARLPSLRFDGLQAYAGHLMHVEGYEERRRRSRQALAGALDTKRAIEKAGFEVGVLSVGGTGTFDIDCEVEGVSDLQVGSYLFMDVQYRAIEDRDGELFDFFEPSLFVLVTVISQPVPELITVDAGFKAFAAEDVKPEFRDVSGLVYHWGGDEHGIVELREPSREVKLGDKLFMLVSHCDPTVNLYDTYHVMEGERVTELWPIAARGKSQ